MVLLDDAIAQVPMETVRLSTSFVVTSTWIDKMYNQRLPP